MTTEQPRAETAPAHACNACEGIDPGTCLMNPDRTEPDNETATALARHIATQHISTVQAAARLLGWELHLTALAEPAPVDEALAARVTKAIHRYDHEHALSGNDLPSKHHRGEAAAVLAELAPELAELLDYRNRITWETTCGEHAALLDSCRAADERAEQAEAEVQRMRYFVAACGEDGHAVRMAATATQRAEQAEAKLAAAHAERDQALALADADSRQLAEVDARCDTAEAALAAIRALHRPVTWPAEPPPGAGPNAEAFDAPVTVCHADSDDPQGRTYWTPWPCATTRTLEETDTP